MAQKIYLNVITLGDSGVGKSSILHRIRDGAFQENIQTTIGVETFILERKYEKKNLIMALKFLDTMGHEQYQQIIPLQYIRNSAIVLLVFDSIASLDTLINRWYQFYKDNVSTDNARFILVGNKSDIFGDKRDEIKKQGVKFSEEIDAHFMTCSAKSNDNMDNLESYIVTEAKRFIDNLETKLNYDIINNKQLNQENQFQLGNEKDKKANKVNKEKKECNC